MLRLLAVRGKRGYMLRVLLVDDSPERTAILRDALERAGYLVAAVLESFLTLLSAVDSLRPDIIMVGNGMAGVRTLEELIKISPDLDMPSGHAYAKALCKVKTSEEVIEYSSAFIQLYREEARYLDRTVHWVERVGLDYVKQRVIDDAESRKALFERLQYALQGEKDPWVERTQGMEKHEFEVLSA